MPKFLNAPQGERNPVDGTEVAPLGSADGLSSWWASLSTVRTFVKSLTDTLYSAYNHTHADSDHGGTVNHTALTGAGTSIHLPAYSSDSTTYLDGNGNWTVPPGGLSSVYDSDILFTDNTVNNSSSDEHGFLPKLNGDTNYFLNGAGSWAVPPAGGTVYDSDIVFGDTTANNADSDMHGFLPKLSGDSDTWLDGKGAWTLPPGGAAYYPQDVFIFPTQWKIVSGVTGGWVRGVDPNQIFNMQQYQNTPANGDSAQVTVMLKDGTYDVYFLGVTANNRGLLDWSMDGTNFNTGQDWYNGTTQQNIIKTGTVTIATSGRHILKWAVNGKNASSNNYYLVVTAVWFTAQSQTSEP